VPLGVNGVRKDLGKQLMRKISELLTASIRYALDHREEAVAYAREFGRGMDAAATDRFVGMYVNPLTLDMGSKGREAIALLLTRAYHAALVPRPVNLEFVE
jgi:1,4-dihydroxy-6-naphthoate synthase